MKANLGLARMLVAGATATSLALFGCGAQQPSTSATEEPAQEQATQTEVPTEDSKSDSAQTEEATTTSSTTNSTEANGQTAQIGEEEAKQIVLQDAGIDEADITQLTINLDSDDGAAKYDVDFNVGTTEYDYEVDATTGAVLERSVELND